MPETLAQKLSRWRRYPDTFVTEVIGATPDPWQIYAMRALVQHKRLSITACHGVGKDALAAWLVLWSIYCWPHPKIPCTAPTQHQLYDLLWAEIAKWRAQMPAWFRNQTEQTAERLEWKGSPETWFAVARTARKENSEAMQGFHADTILIVVDEASGVPEVIFTVLEGAMTGPQAWQLLIGNPTQPTGFFADSHGTDQRWHRMRIMAAAAHDGGKVPSGVWLSDRVSPDYVEAIAHKYGKDSNVYRVRVLGLFPRSSDDQTIPLEWVEKAAMREVPKDHWLKCQQAIVLGVDVARFGDDRTAVVARQGQAIIGAWSWHGHDTQQTTARVLSLARRIKALTKEDSPDALKVRDGHYPRIVVDGVGVGGGVVDALAAYDFLEVVDAQAGEASPDDLTYRRRDHYWWQARNHYSGPGIIAPESTDKRFVSLTEWTPRNPHIDPEIRAQLIGELATPRYGFAPNGRIKVESKSEVKGRLGGAGSPDIADAHNLTMAYPEASKPPTGKQRYDAREAEEASPWTV